MEKKELWFWAIINGGKVETGYRLSYGDCDKVKMQVIADNKDQITEDTEVKVMQPFC